MCDNLNSLVVWNSFGQFICGIIVFCLVKRKLSPLIFLFKILIEKKIDIFFLLILQFLWLLPPTPKILDIWDMKCYHWPSFCLSVLLSSVCPSQFLFRHSNFSLSHPNFMKLIHNAKNNSSSNLGSESFTVLDLCPFLIWKSLRGKTFFFILEMHLLFNKNL